MQIDETTPPETSLIQQYVTAEGHYTDAFLTEAPPEADLARFVTAFYTSMPFKTERLVLRHFAGAKSTDAEARALGAGERDSFAVWTVAARTESEILMRDKSGRTMSWLCVRGGRLWFGSVVIPVMHRGRLTLGPVFYSLLKAHKVYSRVLLSAAAAKLRRS